MDDLDNTIEKQDALRKMDELILARMDELLEGEQTSLVLEAVERLVVGLRLCAVCPSGGAAQYNAWVSLSRAWRTLGLGEAELEVFQKRGGYSSS